ncbi:ABC transporter permease [Dankookia sp. P2]|uniref:ABC transporter permease n=1 Tax=Dankookia sp. P2 TaxID=3423955 RepID=UPI003D67E672
MGLAIGSFRPVRAILEPWTEFFRFIPAVAMITVSVIWFGIGEASKVFLIAYTTVFVVIIATAAGWARSRGTRSARRNASAPRACRSSRWSRCRPPCPLS